MEEQRKIATAAGLAIERGLGGELETIEIAHSREVGDLVRHVDASLFVARKRDGTAGSELSDATLTRILAADLLQIGK